MNTNFTVDWGEVKNGQYGTTFEGTFIRPDGSKFNGVVSQKDKQGVEFPNFGQIRAGSSVLGVEWNNGKGKIYIFAPKPASTGNSGASRGANMTKVVEVKNQNIKDSQERKEIGIKLSSAMNGAVQLAIAELSGTPDKSALASSILNWRTWIINNWGDEKDVIDPTK